MDKVERNFLIFLFILASFIIILVFWLGTNERKSYSPLPRETELLFEKLTPQDYVPPTEEEKKETEKLLEDLTPKKAKSATESQKETEKLLEQLTPR